MVVFVDSVVFEHFDRFWTFFGHFLDIFGYFMYFRTILDIFRLNPLYLYNYTTPVLETFLENYIDTTIEALGDIYAWDVVNEPISNDDNEGHRVDDIWYQIDDVACKAFTWARNKRDELGFKSQLLVNDYNVESMAEGSFKIKSDKLFNWVVDLRNRDCGVEAVGFQTHIDIGYSDAGRWSYFFKRGGGVIFI